MDAALQQLSDLLPSNDRTKLSFKRWCKNNYVNWVTQLHEAIATHRDIGNQWEFDPNQRLVLQKYYDANQLLLDCLHSDCEVTAVIREEIESTLLLPQIELERREWA